MRSIAANALDAYERLRLQAITHGSSGERGFVVLLRRGMLAWALLWTEVAAQPDTPRHPSSNTPVPVTLVTPVVNILAGVVLAGQNQDNAHV